MKTTGGIPVFMDQSFPQPSQIGRSKKEDIHFLRNSSMLTLITDFTLSKSRERENVVIDSDKSILR